MQTERPYVLTIAGLDPCSGAGLTADIKTFEQLKVYGLAVCTGLTLQTEDEFVSVMWREVEEVRKEVDLLLAKYPVKVVKFGIVPSFSFIEKLVSFIKELKPEIQIIIDPVWQSSTGVVFNPDSIVLDKNFLGKVLLITPNVPELKFMANTKNQNDFIEELRQYTNVLLKGGHRRKEIGIDSLFQKSTSTDFVSFMEGDVYPKHGSGCVLSAAIASHLALEKELKEACYAAKRYVEDFLMSNKSLLGFHAA